jgi:RNA polymerase sigma-70 factor (ECF subfamily)
MTLAAPSATEEALVSPSGVRRRPGTTVRRDAAVERPRQGDAWPTGARLYDLIHRQMFTLTGGRHRDLDDLVQTAAIEVMRSRGAFRGQSAVSTWTYQICYRTLLRHHRWYSRWLQRFAWLPDGNLPEHSSGDGAADERLEQAERASRLRAALGTLSPKRRAVVVLRDLEGLDLEEVARIVDAKEGTVRSRLRDGRKDLARRLSEDPYFGDEAVTAAEARHAR